MIITSHSVGKYISVLGRPTPAGPQQGHVHPGTGSDHREAVEEWLRLYAPTWHAAKRLYYLDCDGGVQYWVFIHPDDLAAAGKEVSP